MALCASLGQAWRSAPPPTVKHSINEEQCGFRGKEERQAGGPPVYLVLYSPSQGSPPSTQSDTQAQRAAVSVHTEGPQQQGVIMSACTSCHTLSSLLRCLTQRNVCCAAARPLWASSLLTRACIGLGDTHVTMVIVFRKHPQCDWKVYKAA